MSLLFPEAERESRDFDRDGFEAFWRVYPRKEARKDAVKAWNQARPSGDTQEAILDALAWQCQLKNWQESKRYIPLPASYLRGERWTDEEPRREIPTHRLSPWEQARRAGLK